MLFRYLFLLLALVACTQKKEEAKITQPILTQKEAVARAEQVSNISYNQEFWLDAAKETFKGKTDVAFDWKTTAQPLHLDFFKANIKKMTINGKDADPKYDGRQITIENKYRTGEHQHIVVEYEHTYDPEANGLYRFVDPQDKKVYLYSNLEPNYASVVYPCFDQPDLKATFKMRVHAPSDWVVVTSTLPEKILDSEGVKQWDFPQSAKMATYVWSLHAGPYKIFEDKSAVFPTRLLIRQTLADQVHPEEWFPITKAGLKYYGEFFGIIYPYKKMDLVMVPDFNWGGMENIAAIALTETTVKKGEHTREQKIRIASLLLHEIAHMWFGDLVTMKWWDDLWLNESFATFMEGMSLPQAGYASEAGRSFFGEKQWAYDTDDRVTTHPIAGVVTDTSQAESSFDGITYGKGSSTMKQLMYLITEEKFREGVRSYFQKHRDGNAVLTDFMGELSAAAHKPLDSWTQQWLKTAGLNTAKMEVTCTGGKITTAKIKQFAPKDHPVLREQAMRIAFLRGEGKLDVKDTFRVVFSGDTTDLKEIVGKKCPRIIFPNYQDYGYAKFLLDENSFTQLKSSIATIKDPFVRQMGWNYLWTQVKDGDLSVKEFANIWLKDLPNEPDDKNLEQLIGFARARTSSIPKLAVPSILLYYPPGSDLDAWRAKTDQMLWAEIDKSKPNSDHQRTLIDGILALASQPESFKKIADMLSGSVKIAGFDFDQVRRWSAIKRLAGANIDVAATVSEELKRDSSLAGQQEALAAKSLVPDPKVKEASMASVANDKSDLSFAQRRVVIRNLFPEEQLGLRNQLGKKFFSDLEKFVGAENKSDFFLESYMALAPIKPGKIAEAEQFLTKHTVLPETVHKTLKELIESGERFEKATARADQKVDKL